MEIDPVTFKYAKANLERAGYRDVVLVLADGGFGYPELQPYDRIALTAACMETLCLAAAEDVGHAQEGLV
ncbi:hypothetical protein KMZ93_19690 [Bradyrhizobium sediminis]|uniref:Methyltransferase domain-containing protein n=1 Tax=Bradyrhizobium sediminis TaxID=2840469 RepID=A0A975RWD7_9BRAD|nr:hypothetical protein [Bradyrhizobium sediminis]QWG22184.1 hypothetical protein KMZ93_19690 [Bradyrhizobium sediminis]